MKKILLYIFIFTVVISAFLNANTNISIINYTNYFYTGTLAGKNIIASIEIEENKANGFYYFTQSKKNVELNGTRKNDTLSLKEKNSQNNYELVLKNDKSITGNFKKNEAIALSPLDTFNTRNITKYYLLEKSTNAEREFSYSIEKSEIENKNNLASINSINKKIKSAVSGFEKSVKKELISFRKNATANYQYFYELTPHYIDTNIIVFFERKYIYTGGANGISYSTPKMYSIKTGEEISYKTSSIIKNKNNPDIIEILKKKLLDINDKDIYFDFDSITLPNTFCVSSSGITFIYSLYEIAPRIAGIIEITFTFEEIKPFINNVKNINYLFDN